MSVKILEQGRERLVFQLVPWGTWALTFGASAFLLLLNLVAGEPQGGPLERVLILLVGNPLAWFAYLWMAFGLLVGKVHTLTLDRRAGWLVLRISGLFGSQEVAHPLAHVRRALVVQRRGSKGSKLYAVQLELEGRQKLQLSALYTQGREPKQQVVDLLEGFLKTGRGALPASRFPPAAGTPDPGGLGEVRAARLVLFLCLLAYVLVAVWKDTPLGPVPRAAASSAPVLANVPARPDMLQVGEVGATPAGRSAALAVTRAGVPHVAYVKAEGPGDERLAVVRWEDGGWRMLGEPLTARAGQDGAHPPALVLWGDEAPVVAWAERDAQGLDAIHVRRWAEGAWRPLGEPQRAPARTTRYAFPVLLADRQGGLWLAWGAQSQEGDTAGSTLHVLRWDSERWVAGTDTRLPEALDTFLGPSLAVGAPGELFVGLSSSAPSSPRSVAVWRYGARGWQRLGEPFDAVPGQTGALGPLLAVDSRGGVVAGWREFDEVSTNVYVHQWDGTGWRPLGGAVHGFPGATYAIPGGLEVDAEERPVLAYQERTPEGDRLFLARWDDGAWRFLGPALSATTGLNSILSPRLVLDARGQPWLLWTEKVGGAFKVFVHGPRSMEEGR